MCLTILCALSVVGLNHPVPAKVADQKVGQTMAIFCSICISILKVYNTAIRILHGNKLSNYLNYSG